ncbi:MAG TPA: ISNCY family transposase [Terriglobales bacterium]|nr:ISNCY family transposase [Terriglobales bacterium]
MDQVCRDLQRGLKNPHTGRDGLTPAQVLRSFILRRIKNWEYRELRERIADGYTLRQFTDFYTRPVPKHDAFHRAFNRLTPQTLKTINELIIRAAVEMGLEDGSRLRVDSTCVDTNIHHPTDSRLLWDSVRVLTRLGDRLVEKVGRPLPAFPHHTRAARRRMQAIERMSAKERQEQQVPKYRELLGITEEVVQSARQLLEHTQNAYGLNFKEDMAITALRQEIEDYCQLADQVIQQTRRRVLEGETVPAKEKIYSIFEPHTDMIRRGKVDKPVEFGHKVFLAESQQGLITDYEILEGNPNDQEHVAPSLDRHQELFGHAPEWYGADRGFASPQNERACEQAGVTVIAIPQCGGQKTPERAAYEKSTAFKKGQRFRAGIEGRISVLFRGRGMKRCLDRGRERFDLLVAAAVLANNLLRIATLLHETKRGGRRS